MNFAENCSNELYIQPQAIYTIHIYMIKYKIYSQLNRKVFTFKTHLTNSVESRMSWDPMKYIEIKDYRCTEAQFQSYFGYIYS